MQGNSCLQGQAELEAQHGVGVTSRGGSRAVGEGARLILTVSMLSLACFTGFELYVSSLNVEERSALEAVQVERLPIFL